MLADALRQLLRTSDAPELVVDGARYTRRTRREVAIVEVCEAVDAAGRAVVTDARLCSLAGGDGR